MASLNKVQLIGFLGADPEMRFTPSGKEVLDISVATSETWKDAAGNRQEETEWHTVTCWGQLAINVNQYLHKGSMVYVEGRKKTDKVGEGDAAKYYCKIVASKVTFLDRNGGQQAVIEPIAEENIPF